jgi:hypothetical protein
MVPLRHRKVDLMVYAMVCRLQLSPLGMLLMIIA